MHLPGEDEAKPGMVPGQKPPGQGDQPPGQGEEEAPPEPKDGNEAMSLYTRAKKHMEFYAEHCKKFGCQMAEGNQDAIGKKAKNEYTQGVMKMTETELRNLVSQTVSTALATHTKKDIETLQKFREDTLGAEKKRGVDAIITRLDLAGKLPPARKESVRAQLMTANTSDVIKFSEGGQEVALSSFDLAVKNLEAMPSMFGERIRPGIEQTSEDLEVDKVGQHWEMYAETFTNIGTPKAELVDAFKHRRKQDRTLTADRFLNVK